MPLIVRKIDNYKKHSSRLHTIITIIVHLQHTGSVTLLESFGALKLTLLESFRALPANTLLESFRVSILHLLRLLGDPP